MSSQLAIKDGTCCGKAVYFLVYRADFTLLCRGRRPQHLGPRPTNETRQPEYGKAVQITLGDSSSQVWWKLEFCHVDFQEGFGTVV